MDNDLQIALIKLITDARRESDNSRRDMLGVITALKEKDKGDKGDPGKDGDDGTSIVGAKVERGQLYVSLSNGKIINTGRVKGDPGKNGKDGKDGVITQKQLDRVISQVLKLMPEPTPGKDGKDFELTDEIMDEILLNMQALVPEIIPDSPEQLAAKINTLDKAIDFKTIKNVPKKVFGGGQGGGTGIEVIKSGGVSVKQGASEINFTGATVTATPNGVNVAITGGSGHDAVTLAGEDYLSLSGQVITANAIDLDNLSATGTPSASTYLRGDNTWATPAGSGDVSKVGTPVDNQIGVWTGDGTLEGDAALTFDTTTDTLAIGASGKLAFGAVSILDDTAGTTTLSNIDAIDATTETTIESAIDTLPNLASVQGQTLTLAGAFVTSGANSLTLTTTGATSVTLPTTGTLATTAQLHDAVTVADSSEIDLTLTGQQISASIVTGSIDETKLDASVNASLDLADSSLQPGAIGSTVQAYDADLATIAGLSSADGNFIVGSATGWVVESGATARASLGAGTGDGDALTTNPLSQFAATTSLQLKGVISDETGSGALVFATSPTLVTPALGTPSSGTLTNCTGLPVAGITASTSTALGVGSIELGHATDTTISRVSAGVIAVEGVNVLTTATGLVSTTPFTKAITVESPTSSEDITMFFTDDAITVTQLNAVLNGSSTPSVTWTIRHNSDRSATGAEVVTGGTTTTSTTTGSEVTSFNDATIPAGSWVWLETTAQSGTVNALNVTVEYTRD